MSALTSLRQQGRARRVAMGLLVACVAASASLGMTSHHAADDELTSYFVDASPLLVGNEVRVNGVKVGEVKSLTVDGAVARVVMDLTPEAYPIHRDATLTIRPVTLLGERYIDLNQGTDTAPLLASGATIGTKQTGQATGLDEVLNTIDDPTGEALAAVVTMLGDGLQGNGSNAADTLAALAPAMKDTGRLAAVLRGQTRLINRTIDNLEPVTAALADGRGHTLDALAGNTEQLLSVTAANREALAQTLGNLPATLATARRTLAKLARTSDKTAPVLDNIRPVTDNVNAISGEISSFADAANPALAGTNKILDKAQALLDAAAPVAESLRLTGGSVNATARSARPLARDLTANISNVLNFIKFWALSTNGRDGLSHYFRGALVLSPDAVTSALPGTSRGATTGSGPLASLNSATGGLVGHLGLGQLAHGLGATTGGLLGGLLGGNKRASGSATGMTRTQEQNAVTSLLGLGGN